MKIFDEFEAVSKTELTSSEIICYQVSVEVNVAVETALGANKNSMENSMVISIFKYNTQRTQQIFHNLSLKYISTNKLRKLK